MKTRKPFAHRICHKLPNLPLAVKFYFALGGVNVHVDLARFDFEEQTAHRIFPLHQRRVITLAQRHAEADVVDGALVYKYVLMLAITAAHARRADEAPHAARLRRGIVRIKRSPCQLACAVDFNQAQPLAPQRAQPPFQCRRARTALRQQPPHLAVIVPQRERHLRMRQSHQRQHPLHVCAFGFFRAQKFPPRRQIVKQRPHLHRRAHRRAGFLHRHHLAAVHDNLRAALRLRQARGQHKTAHTRDTRHRLPAKTHRGNRRQILRARNLTRCVPLQAHQRIIPAHSVPIIRHPNQTAPARLHLHRDLPRPRIQRILHQLLHHTRRPFHHLARRDLIRHLFGK